MLAFYLHNLDPILWRITDSLALRWYGLAYVLAFLIGYWLYQRLAQRGYTDLPPDEVADFITWAAVFGVMVGGRLGWTLFYGLKQDHTGESAWWPLQVWKGGMSSHGGILGLVLFTLFWARRHRISWTSIGDTLVVVAPIGLFLVRMANFINGELYGRVAKVAWAMQFPTELLDNPRLADLAGASETMPVEAIIAQARHNSEIADRLRAILPPRHPSQIYEALLEGVVLFVALWVLRTRFRLPRGVLTGAFFILYALLRIAAEVFREPDPAWHVAAFSAGQFLSLFMILIGAAFIGWGVKTQQYEQVFVSKGDGAIRR